MVKSEHPSHRFVELAEKIVAGRTARGFTQVEFAAELGFKQQAVSRWEAGTHRPAVAQIPVLAALIDDNVTTLMQLAGYGSPVSASLSTQFPVDALDPATFEQFVADVVNDLHPGANARVHGGRGHKQKGTDIIARFLDGRIWSFQCKRVERFGRADVEKVIADHDIKAERCFLVLSKIASPAAADAVHAHDGWTLWDKPDLTRKIRTLPIETQERLVDIYFPGQRMPLLGRIEPGPWRTEKEYFEPFRGRGAVLSHDWSLVGREDEIAKLVAALGRSDMPFVLLVGAGGMGKTRILKEGIKHFAAKTAGTAIHFLSSSQEPDAASLYKLGTHHKLLVVDDAHDREGLKLLIEYSVDPTHRTRLLIATRPYAEQRIRNELALYGVVDPSTVRLEHLEKQALQALVVEVLDNFHGNPEWASGILAIAGDNPLVAAMAAQVVAREGMIPELARGERVLRQIILSRFTDVITGDLGAPADTPLLRSVLELLAVIQPFHVDDRRVAELVEATRPGVVTADVSRALRMLVDGGVIYKRGQLYRLMPDLLGDFLIEASCIGTDGQLTDFALNVADAVDGNRLTQVLVNLGRMDWRRMEGDPSDSAFLEPIWRKLRAIDDKYDPRIEAIQAVAYYQPGQALEFVQAQINQDRELNDVSGILRRIAFSPKYRRDALRLLWDLGLNDNRDLNPHPSHPIRTLAELVEYSPHKPLSFSEEVAEFGFALLDDEADAWLGRYSPFDVLAPLLKGEGMTTKSTGRGITMSPFFVDYAAVAQLRARVIERTIALLQSGNPRASYRAACFLNDAVRPPLGMFNSSPPAELSRQLEAEFSQTIRRVGTLIAGGTLAVTTVIGLVRSLHWYAEYDEGALRDQVRDIFGALPHSLDFRLRAAFAEGADYNFVGQVHYSDWGEDREWLDSFVAEVLHTYPDRRALCSALVQHCEAIKVAGMSTVPGYHIVERLIARDPAIGDEIIVRALANPNTSLRDYLGIAARALIETQPENGRALIAQMLASPEPTIRSEGARGLVGLSRAPNSADVTLLNAALRNGDPEVTSIAVRALRTWRVSSAHEMIALVLAVEFDRDPDAVESIGMLLCASHSSVIDHLREEDVRLILNRMEQSPRIEGHWTGEILSGLTKRHGVLVAQFLLARAELGLSGKASEDYRAIGYSRRRNNLALQDAPAANAILELTWIWLRRYDDASGWARYQIGEIFAAMFKLDSPPMVEFFNTMLDRATAGDLRWISDILRNSHHRFVFEHRGFVERYLDRCKAVEAKLVNDAIGQLIAAATSGEWYGGSGEPAPRDIQTQDDANAVLTTLSRLSPAFPLYKAVLEDAKRNIARSIAEGEALDDDE